MDHESAALLKIGLFSRLSSISVRMLRHYQANGILEPAMTDHVSGHRFYTPAQLVTAHWVVLLREAGLRVRDISEVLERDGDPAQLLQLMTAQRRRIADERAKLAAMERAFHRINTYLEGSTMDINVRTEHMPAMTVAALRRVLPHYADEGSLWHEIGPLLAQSHVAMPNHDSGICGATFFDPDYRESDVDVEVWQQVPEPFEPAAPMTCQALPARDVVVATLKGSYDGITEVTAAIGSYLAAHHLDTGPMFNIYHVSPAKNPDPSTWVTDVCFPIL